MGRSGVVTTRRPEANPDAGGIYRWLTLRTERSEEQARAQLASIRDMVAALECDYDRLAELTDERETLVDELTDAARPRPTTTRPRTNASAGGRPRQPPGGRWRMGQRIPHGAGRTRRGGRRVHEPGGGPRADRGRPAVGPGAVGLAQPRRGPDRRRRGIRNLALHRRAGLPDHRRARRVVRAADGPDRAPGLVHAVDRVYPADEADREAVLTYARCFYFGG